MNDTALTDEQLLDLWRTHYDQGAFAELHGRYQDELLGYAFSMLRTMGIPDAAGCAQECVQETFLRLSSQTRSIPCARAWLYLVLRNRVIDEGRRRGRSLPTVSLHAEEGDRIDPADDGLGPLDKLINDDQTPNRIMIFWECLHELPLGLVQVFVLFHVLDRSCDEIEGQIGVPKSTLGPRLHRARKQLRECYCQRLGANEGRSEP